MGIHLQTRHSNAHTHAEQTYTASALQPTMSNPTVIPSPTMMGITAWAISPASAGTRFWCTGNQSAQTPNKDSLATPAGAKTNFSLSNIDTPSGLFSSFWTNKQNGLETPKLANENDSDFVDLDTSKPEPSNSILDVMDMKMPPTPKKTATASVCHRAPSPRSQSRR